MSAVLPKQKVKDRKKGYDFGKDTIDYFIDQSGLDYDRNDEIRAIHKAIDGQIDEGYYKYVLNPYNSEDKKYRNLPAKLRSLNILEPVFNGMIGEHSTVYGSSQVISTNEDNHNRLKAALNKAGRDYLNQVAINTLNEMGIDTGAENVQLPPYGELLDEKKSTWDDERSIIGQEALDYITQDKRTANTFQLCREDWYKVGRCFTYKEPSFNDIRYEYVPAEELWVSMRPGVTFVEDGDAVVRRTRMSFNSIIDLYRKFLTDEDINTLEDRFRHLSGDPAAHAYTDHTLTTAYSTDNYYTLDDLESVWHICWKGLEEIAILTYVNDIGITEEMEVHPDYELNPEAGDIKIDYEYKNVVYDGVRIGDDIYTQYKDRFGRLVPFRKFPAQREMLNNSSKCKLPYNGLIQKTRTGKVKSLGKTGIPYQVLYNVTNYKLEATMSANKDKLMLMPKGLIPAGWKMDKWLYHVDATKIAWYDETHPKLHAILQGIKDIDLSLGKYVSEMIAYLNHVKNEWWDTVGFNRQRLGGAMASDGKAVTQEAIFRSSMITAELNRQFSQFMESDQNGLLDISKIAWIDGKKGSYITSDRRRVFFEINGAEHLETDHAVFVKETDQEKRKFELLQQTLQAMAQNNLPKQILAEIIDETNFARVKELAAKADKIEQEFQLRMQREKIEADQQKTQIEAENNQADRQTDIEVAEIGAASRIQVAEINAAAKMVDNALSGTYDADNDGIVDEADNNLNERKQRLDEKKHADDVSLRKEELGIKRQEVNIKRNQSKSNNSDKA